MKPKSSRQYWVMLGLMTAFCFLGLFIRNSVVNKDPSYVNLNFMLWNLFLAWIPLPLAWLSYILVNRVSKAVVIFLTFGWLLFYPNAPYMISDVIHVNKDASPLLLYDGLLIFSFAILALFYGFFSLKLVHRVYRIMAGNKTANLVLVASILLSSFGIYLGRILRLNSWDLFSRPLQVMADIFDHLFPPTQNPVTYVIVFFFSAIQFMLLQAMHNLDEGEEEQVPGKPAGQFRLLKTNTTTGAGFEDRKTFSDEAW